MSPFPLRLELGPVLGHRRVDVEVAALGEQVGARGGGALGGGEHQLEAVLGVGRAGVAVGDAAPQVDDLAAADVHGGGRAHLAVLLEVGAERVRHAFEPGLDRAHRSPSCHPPGPRVGTGVAVAARERATSGELEARRSLRSRLRRRAPRRRGRPTRRPWSLRRRCRSGAPGAARPPPRASPTATDTTMHTHARRTSSRAVAGGPTSRPNTSRLPAERERRHHRDRDQGEQRDVREVRAQAEAGRLALVEGQREERPVAHHARDHHDERPRPPAPRCRPSRRGRCRRTGAARPPPRATRTGR